MTLSSKELQKMLDNTDWTNYDERVNWRVQMPECQFYDGEYAKQERIICPVWQGWLSHGRELHKKDSENIEHYLDRLKQILPEGFRSVEHERIEEFFR